MSYQRKLVDEQAKDEALWFDATSASEAYLQQELRKLHAAVEYDVKTLRGIVADSGCINTDDLIDDLRVVSDVARTMRPIVDAAMALYRAWDAKHKADTAAFMKICRKYEEQTHGPCQCCERIGEKPLPTADSLEWQCDCACHFTGEVEHG